MGKKKKSRRISQSDCDQADALLNEILVKSPQGRASNKPASQEEDKAIIEKDASTPALDIEEPSPKSKSCGKCQHVKGAFKLPKLTKGLSLRKEWSRCQGCQDAKQKAEKQALRQNASMAGLSLTESKPENTLKALPSNSLWICLSCCEINCGRDIENHALAHQHSLKSNHPLAINLGTMECWCYNCDNQIDLSKNQLIKECQVAIERAYWIRQSKMRAAPVVILKKVKGSSNNVAASTTTITTAPKAKVFTPGLQNLGNTCFFNSVAQILVESKSLRSILSENERERLVFPESLAASTDAGLGPLTTNFKDFLNAMWKQRGGTVAPQDLFMQIARKWKAFRGFRQQDSHELMRYLFDGIKQEERDMIKRRLSEDIAEEAKKSGQKPSTEGAGNEQGSETSSASGKDLKYVPFIDSCFSGRLVSVIVCDACKKCSYAPENFFDLSLPVRGPARQVSASIDTGLKARPLARSKRTSSPEQVSTSAGAPYPEDNNLIPERERPSEAYMRHIEKVLKNIGRFDSDTLSIQRSLNQFTSVDILDDENKFACENCYKLTRSSKKNDTAPGQPEQECDNKEGGEGGTKVDEDHGVQDDTFGFTKPEKNEKENEVERRSSGQEEQGAVKDAVVDEEVQADMPETADVEEGKGENVEEHQFDSLNGEQEVVNDKGIQGNTLESTKSEDSEGEEYDYEFDLRKKEQEVIEDKGLQDDTPDSIKLEKSEGAKGEEYGSGSEVDSQDSRSVDDDKDADEHVEKTDRFGNTIPRKAKDKAPAKEKQEEPEYVLRKAFKRYLISRLPPTLVLHLKRFEQSGRFDLMRKIEDHIDIPVELDMGPYFVPNSEIEDESEGGNSEHQRQQDDGLSKKYKLYGVVVHMGTLGGGHYTNYVLSSKVSKSEAPSTVDVVAERKEKANKEIKATTSRHGPLDVPSSVLTVQQQEENKDITRGTTPSSDTQSIIQDQDTQDTGDTKDIEGTKDPHGIQDAPDIQDHQDAQGAQDTHDTKNTLDAHNAMDTQDIQSETVMLRGEKGATGTVSDTRQWIACSDTSVRPASINEVLASRAYLLFYERTQ